MADPVITLDRTQIGGGLARYDINVDFRDGLGRSGFVQVTFSGPFDAQSQLLESNWPDIQEVQSTPTLYSLQGGTGGGSSVDIVGLGQMVLPVGQSFSYSGVISRNGQNFTFVPEPGVAALAKSSLATLAALGMLAAHSSAVRTRRS